MDRYLIWNEPNQKGWLQPQWERVSGRYQPVSPHIYNTMAEMERVVAATKKYLVTGV